MSSVLIPCILFQCGGQRCVLKTELLKLQIITHINCGADILSCSFLNVSVFRKFHKIKTTLFHIIWVTEWAWGFEPINHLLNTHNLAMSSVAVINVESVDSFFLGGSMNWNREKITTLLSLTSNWNLAFHSIMSVGNKVI
jgi:hypothetical protein